MRDVEYLAAENRLLKVQFKGRLKLSPQAGGPQIRWLEGPSKPRQASDQGRG
jgi:hypothetical protein